MAIYLGAGVASSALMALLVVGPYRFHRSRGSAAAWANTPVEND